ncbi:MAG: hypothetical protein J3K34DRAFT_459070 [Monoraphidium minutum]|nr:MAG: hypothetical protein J3K34DRAFT_459070 [Monoraphidium minutum]
MALFGRRVHESDSEDGGSSCDDAASRHQRTRPRRPPPVTRPHPCRPRARPQAAEAAAMRRRWVDTPYERWAKAGCSLLKYHLRGGCPPELRPAVWLHASGGAALAAARGAPSYRQLARGGYAALARRRASSFSSLDGSVGALGALERAPTGGSAAAASEGYSASSASSVPVTPPSPRTPLPPPPPAGADNIRACISGGEWASIRDECTRPLARGALPPAAAAALASLPGAPAALQRILVALAARRPAPGAVWRGAGAAAAFLLAVVRDEEAAFWTLAGLADRLFAHCAGQQARGRARGRERRGACGRMRLYAQFGCLVEARLLSTLAAAKLPRLHAHISRDLEIDPAELLLPWVSSCFVDALQDFEETARVWDCLLFEGPKVLHRAGLALLAACEPAVLACGQPDALPRLLGRRAAQALGGRGGNGALVGAAYRRSVVGCMAHEKIDALRAAAAAEVAGHMDDKRRRLEEIAGHSWVMSHDRS